MKKLFLILGAMYVNGSNKENHFLFGTQITNKTIMFMGIEQLNPAAVTLLNFIEPAILEKSIVRNNNKSSSKKSRNGIDQEHSNTNNYNQSINRYENITYSHNRPIYDDQIVQKNNQHISENIQHSHLEIEDHHQNNDPNAPQPDNPASSNNHLSESSKFLQLIGVSLDEKFLNAISTLNAYQYFIPLLESMKDTLESLLSNYKESRFNDLTTEIQNVIDTIDKNVVGNLTAESILGDIINNHRQNFDIVQYLNATLSSANQDSLNNLIQQIILVRNLELGIDYMQPYENAMRAMIEIIIEVVNNEPNKITNFIIIKNDQLIRVSEYVLFLLNSIVVEKYQKMITEINQDNEIMFPILINNQYELFYDDSTSVQPNNSENTNMTIKIENIKDSHNHMLERLYKDQVVTVDKEIAQNFFKWVSNIMRRANNNKLSVKYYNTPRNVLPIQFKIETMQEGEKNIVLGQHNIEKSPFGFVLD